MKTLVELLREHDEFWRFVRRFGRLDRMRFRDGRREDQPDECKHRNPEVCAWLGDAQREGRPCAVCGRELKVAIRG